MKRKSKLKETNSNHEFKCIKNNSVLSHFRSGWCSACQGPCDWRYFMSIQYNKRNLGKKPRNKNKPWAKKD